MHGDGLIEEWQCDLCGLKLKNIVLPVRHSCRSRGLGDTVAKVTSSLGIKPCGRCKERQKRLNKLVPYGIRQRAPQGGDEEAPG